GRVVGSVDDQPVSPGVPALRALESLGLRAACRPTPGDSRRGKDLVPIALLSRLIGPRDHRAGDALLPPAGAQACRPGHRAAAPSARPRAREPGPAALLTAALPESPRRDVRPVEIAVGPPA